MRTIAMPFWLGLAALLLLPACSNETTVDEGIDWDSAQVGVETRLPGRSDSRISLPGGVHLDTAARLRAETISQTEGGATRRTLVIELLEDGPTTAQATITRAFTRAGYRAAKPKAGTAGKTGIRYTRAGAPSVWVVLYPDVTNTPAHPDAKSMISVSMQVRAGRERTK